MPRLLVCAVGGVLDYKLLRYIKQGKEYADVYVVIGDVAYVDLSRAALRYTIPQYILRARVPALAVCVGPVEVVRA